MYLVSALRLNRATLYLRYHFIIILLLLGFMTLFNYASIEMALIRGRWRWHRWLFELCNVHRTGIICTRNQFIIQFNNLWTMALFAPNAGETIGRPSISLPMSWITKMNLCVWANIIDMLHVCCTIGIRFIHFTSIDDMVKNSSGNFHRRICWVNIIFFALLILLTVPCNNIITSKL